MYEVPKKKETILETTHRATTRSHLQVKYIQMDLTGRHVASGGKDVYGLVCVCLQTYNTRIYGIESRKLEAISLAIEVLVQEVGPPDFIACDKEGSFQQFAKILDKEGIEKLPSIRYSSNL